MISSQNKIHIKIKKKKVLNALRASPDLGESLLASCFLFMSAHLKSSTP